MKKTYQIQHNEHVTRLPFHEVIQANEQVMNAARKLDEKLIALAVDVTGVEA